MILKTASFAELLTHMQIDAEKIKSISKFSLDDFQLTFAETILIYEGAALGIADCRICASEKDLKNISVYNHCISGELLELLLTPEIAKLVFTKEKIVIQGARIYRRSDMIRLKNNLLPNKHYSLEIHDINITTDIIFRDCIFGGGINLQNSRIKNLTFERVDIYHSWNPLRERFESFTAMNLQVEGNLIFTHENTETHNKEAYSFGNKPMQGVLPKKEITDSEFSNDTNTNQKEENFLSNFSSTINLQNAVIKGRLEFVRVKIDGFIDADDLRAKQVTIEGAILAKTLFMNNAVIDGKTIFFNTRSYGNLILDNCYLHSLNLTNCQVQKTLSLTFAKIRGLFACINTEITGGADGTCSNDFSEYSINARGITASDIFMRGGFVATNGVDLFRCEISDGIDFSESIILANSRTRVAVSLSRAKIGTGIQTSPNAIFVGSFVMDETYVGGSVQFSKTRFINRKNASYTISGKNTRIGKSLLFRSSVFSDNKEDNYFSDRDSSNINIKELLIESSKLKEKVLRLKEKLYQNNDRFAFKNLKEMKEQGNSEKLKSEFYRRGEWYYNFQKNEEIFLEEAFSHYDEALQHLKTVIKNESAISPNSGVSLTYIELQNTLVIGEIFFPGIQIGGQADFSGTLLYAMNVDANTKKTDDFPNALTMKFSRVEGELFLNEGPKNSEAPFRILGELNLHSSKINQLFISPVRGIHPGTKWKIIGLKYAYIYSNEKYEKTSLLEKCEWFYDYDEENNRQPYEELAAAYLRAGDDTKARKVLMRAVARNPVEKSTLTIISKIARIGIPHYRSLVAIILLILMGTLFFSRSAKTNAFVVLNSHAVIQDSRDSVNGTVNFSPFAYSLENLIPFLNSEQKQLFAVDSHSMHNFFGEHCLLYVDSGLITAIYLGLHSFCGVLFLSMFIIGITRIFKRS